MFAIVCFANLNLTSTLLAYVSVSQEPVSIWFQRFYYLAQKLCFWTGIIFIRVYVSVCLSVCVCVSVFISIISKSAWPILMKLGRMIFNDKRQVPFEDELNWFIRTEVTENSYLYFFLLFPFDDFFSEVTSPFLLLER